MGILPASAIFPLFPATIDSAGCPLSRILASRSKVQPLRAIGGTTEPFCLLMLLEMQAAISEVSCIEPVSGRDPQYKSSSKRTITYTIFPGSASSEARSSFQSSMESPRWRSELRSVSFERMITTGRHKAGKGKQSHMPS